MKWKKFALSIMSFLENKNILVISPEFWGEIFVSKHHYAVELCSRGNNVYFLNPPTGHLSVCATNYKQIWEIHYPGFPRGMRFFPSFLQRYFINKQFQKLQRIVGVSFDIVWSFDSSVFFDFSALPNGIIKILHIVDLTQDFQTAKAAASADLCFGTTSFICQRLKMYNNRTYKVSHGLSSSRLKSNKIVSLPGNNILKAMYVGNLAIPYIDWNLLEAAINEFIDVDFIFIGPSSSSNLSKDDLDESILSKFKSKPNVFFIGAVSSPEIAAYLDAANILFIAYLYEKYPEQLASPHKVMEYLSSGKPIVATWTEEYAGTDVLYMGKTKEDFMDTFNWVVQNLELAASPLVVAKRQQYALENTYYKHLERIDELIEQGCTWL